MLNRRRRVLLAAALSWAAPALGAGQPAPKPSRPQPQPSRAPAEPIVRSDGSDVGITIMGAIVQPDSENNVALVKDGGSVKAVKKDHSVGDFKVVAVRAEYLELRGGGKHYFIYQDKFAADAARSRDAKATPTVTGVEGFSEDGFERSKTRVTMTAMYRDKLVKDDLAKVLMQATAEPQVENGVIVGFKVSQIDDGSIYQKAGLKDEDVITAINGQELTSVAGAISLLKQLKGADHLDIEVRRGDKPLKFSIDIR
jgi:type II secretory pathway component PulC